ncbi:MAG: leucine-rich repeat domain-containing protein [Lachnospiraceae bacterium]|nr:leucine-rich repeat domain-containing protein [Lachnospiraceae bacterium]
MTKSTKIGWILITAALVMAVWVFTSHSSEADQTTDAGFVLNDSGTELKSYQGSGGSVQVPDGVTTIDSGVFANNSSITNVSLPNSVTTLGSRAFSGATNLRSVTLGRVTSIPASTFQNCMSLTSVSIPSTVTGIGSQAFYGCAALGSITIPGGVSSINANAFGECNNLTSISASNSFYSSYDGCLYNASGSRLILVPPGKSSVSFSSNVRTIGSRSFSYNRNISSVSIPNSVDAIESGAFTNSAVSSITIPRSVVSIGSQGSWKPGEMYGYQNSAAKTYANSNGITFIALDPGRGSNSDTANGSSSSSGITNNDDPDAPSDDPQNNDDPDSPSNDNNGGNSNNSNGKKNNGGSGASGNASKGGKAINGGGNGGSNANSGGKGASYNGKDVTPKTADISIDIRYIFCAVILLLGVFIMVWGNKRKYSIVRKQTKEA